ncbi:MAG TPA: DNA translocase FtsK, partial [Polyangiaceae bacterium]|nr:DNA translocase FtsK [Polyangiaceae bacterium]
KDIARLAREPRIDVSPRDEAIIAAQPLDADDGLAGALVDPPAAPRRRARRPKAEPAAAAGPAVDAPATSEADEVAAEGGSRGSASDAADASAEAAPTEDPRSDAESPARADADPPAVASEPHPKPRRSRKAAPTIVDTSAALDKEGTAEDLRTPKGSTPTFALPSMDMLVAQPIDPNLAVDHDKLLANAHKLVETLAHYGVQGKVEDILPGPTVTTYEVSPAAGTKVSKVAGLADDLALALARKVRIVAPIPGKNRIGFELPNDRRVRVVLRDLIEDRRFQALAVPLPVVLGRDILGNPVYADLASMPHVIVAGATGAGKSVGLNVMLLSLLYRRSPEELRLLMIDPKVVELAPFDRIPHMLLPVVTDMKQAANALKWAVDEMERRYQLFADAGTKNVATYNAWAERVARGEAKNVSAKVVVAKDHNGLPEEIPAEAGEGTAPLPEKLPWVVIVVDEFADLMMQQGKEVEAAIARLAQKARAAGMHVILATQRPSTDVITGTIKANFPTRIAYRVAQKVDSRTILDEQGAEHLLGMGDMLIKLNGTGETKRVQCPWVSEEEVQRVTDFLRTQGEPVYDENILKPRDDEAPPEEDDGELDPLYDDAVRLVAETRRCSTSWLQRKLGLGYNRAARIVETMERRGLVGPANGAKDREVLVGAL